MAFYNVIMIDRNGKTLDEMPRGDLPLLNDLLPEYADPNFPYLGYFDPYGDMFFSSFQMKPFREEWRRLRGRTTTPLYFELLDVLDAFADRCQHTVDSYFRFISE